MNVLFLTQSNSLQVFHGVYSELRERLGLERVGFYVSDRRYFDTFRQAQPDIESDRFHVVKEWELVARRRLGAPDPERLREFERRLGVPSLWNAIVADRRLSMGPLSALRQDYRARFSHEELLRILLEGLDAFERAFDAVRPDAVVSFICVTLGDYLGYLFARQRGVPFLNLRPTRIRNYVTYGDSVYEPSALIRATYERFRRQGIDPGLAAEARTHIETVRRLDARYEGVVSPSRRPPGAGLRLGRLVPQLGRLVREEYAYFARGHRSDHHSPHWITTRVYRRLLNPARARLAHLALGGRYLGAADVGRRPFVFFPLHTEPEVSLLVYSRPFRNQIEVVRRVAESVPTGFDVVVKEHPASVGKRPMSYYRKLLAIPNVQLADPALESRVLVERAAAVTTIAGSVGLEALLQGKPVLTFGRTPYGILPESMTRRVERLDETAEILRDLLEAHRRDDEALVAFVAATMAESAPIDLYSTLLGKVGVYRPSGQGEAAQAAWRSQIHLLAGFTERCLHARLPVSATGPG